jgi:hypothetical protein
MRRRVLGAIWQAGFLVAGLILATVASPESLAQSMPAAPGSPGGARIWFYRDYEPSVSLNLAAVELNGAVVGYAQPDGSAFYRDVAPGRYRVSVVSPQADVNQSGDIDLALGQEAFIKVLVSSSWESSGDVSSYKRDTFYLRLIPPQIARAELPTHPLTGG